MSIRLKVYIDGDDIPYDVQFVDPQTLEQARRDAIRICQDGFWRHGRMFFPSQRIRYIVIDDGEV